MDQDVCNKVEYHFGKSSRQIPKTKGPCQFQGLLFLVQVKEDLKYKLILVERIVKTEFDHIEGRQVILSTFVLSSRRAIFFDTRHPFWVIYCFDGTSR